MKKQKWKCVECGLIMYNEGMLVAQDPFDSDLEVLGCPSCVCVSEFVRICDYEGCTDRGTGGKQTGKGYMFLCGEHWKEEK